MTNKPTEEQLYKLWLEERRGARPSATFADQVMNQVVTLNCRRDNVWWLLLVDQIERRWAARFAVCGGALAIGCLPYLFLTHVSSI